jgi:hypothetical protein
VYLQRNPGLSFVARDKQRIAYTINFGDIGSHCFIRRFFIWQLPLLSFYLRCARNDKRERE